MRNRHTDEDAAGQGAGKGEAMRDGSRGERRRGPDGRGLGVLGVAGAFGVAALLALALGGFGHYFASAQRQDWHPPPDFHAVTYRVTGTATSTTVSYQPGPYRDGVLQPGGVSRTSFSPVRLPWSRVEYLPPMGLPSLTVIVHGSGQATAGIDVDGRPWRRARAVRFPARGKLARSPQPVYGGNLATAMVQDNF